MRGGDIGHVERRILAHQQHVELIKATPLARAGAVMIAACREGQRLADGLDPASSSDSVSGVYTQPVAAALRLERKGEGGVTADVDGPDRVHLQGYGSDTGRP